MNYTDKTIVHACVGVHVCVRVYGCQSKVATPTLLLS